MKLKRIFLVLLVLFAYIVLVNTNVLAQVEQIRRENLTVALSGEPQTLEPYSHSNQKGFVISLLIFDNLVNKTDDGEIEPELSTSWEYLNPTTLVMKLREGVTFHDGSKFTAKDVRFTLLTASTSSFSRNLFGCIDNDNTKVIDDYTIEIKLLYEISFSLMEQHGSLM